MRSEQTVPVRHSPWAITLGTVSGIPIRVHLTFGLLILWIALAEHNTKDALTEVLFFLSIFTCVLLHELGHALVARRFGVGTRDIVLYPFGGIASLTGRVTPWSELWIALAGPAVNLLIALAILPLLDWRGLATFEQTGSILVRLFAANIFLAVFNMIPAIPMDGGRVLRAVLALLKIRRATAISARLSQILSILLGIVGLYVNNPILVLIAVIVFTNSIQELMQERAQLGAVGYTLGDVMVAREHLLTFTHGMTVSEALNLALKSVQPSFPVLFGDEIMGVVSRDALLQEAATSTDEQYISGVMERNFSVVSPDERVIDFLNRAPQDEEGPVLVTANGHLLGMVYREKLFEFLYLHGIRRARAEQQSKDEKQDFGI